MWSDLTSADISEQWEEDWLLTSVVNYVLVTDPTTRQPGFNIPRCSLILNRFQPNGEDEEGSCITGDEKGMRH